MLWLIDRFGWDAAHSAPAHEIRRMLAAENVYNAARGYLTAEDKPDWAGKNKTAYAIYERALLARREINGEC